MKAIGILFFGLLLSAQVWASEETRELSSFSSLDIGGAFKVTLKKTGKHRVSIDASDDVMNKIKTEVVGSTLKVYIKDNNFRTSGQMNLVIEFSNLDGMDLSGASTVVCDDVITASTFELDISGAGRTELVVETERLKADMTGAGLLKLRGKAKEQTIDITGAGSYDAEDFDCDYTDIESSGAGTARVVANKELRAECSGAGSVRYKGNPEKVYADSNGAGSVKRIN